MGSLATNPDALSWIESYARCELSLDELYRKVLMRLENASCTIPIFES
jgi:hypothetical protein